MPTLEWHQRPQLHVRDEEGASGLEEAQIFEKTDATLD